MVKKAVLIGINYLGTQNELRGCITDIKNIKNVLVKNCGWLDNNIQVMTDEEQTKPTFDNITKGISWLCQSSMPGDTLMFYYSGHGAKVKDTADLDLDEVIVPVDYSTSGLITDDWLYTNLVCKVPSGVTLWGFSDSCYSGTLFNLRYNVSSKSTLKKKTPVTTYLKTEWTDSYDLEVENAKESTGSVCFFSGCTDQETSEDAYVKNIYQGAFTYCFLDTLKSRINKVADGSIRFTSGSVKMIDLIKEINCRLQINGFIGQDSQLSLNKLVDLNRTLDL